MFMAPVFTADEVFNLIKQRNLCAPGEYTADDITAYLSERDSLPNDSYAMVCAAFEHSLEEVKENLWVADFYSEEEKKEIFRKEKLDFIISQAIFSEYPSTDRAFVAIC